jgi:hypothetical protein
MADPLQFRRRSTASRSFQDQEAESRHASYYLNRELSWLEFDRRVLEEARDASLPLLERVKFLSIFASNLDEFFMVRVSGLRRQLEAGVVRRPADGMSPAEQLAKIREQLQPMREALIACWRDDLRPKLREQGIHVLSWAELKGKQRKHLRKHFEREIFPTLTPLAFDPSHPFPHISNLSINLAVVVNDPVEGERFARLKVPGTFPRLLHIDADGDRPAGPAATRRRPSSGSRRWWSTPTLPRSRGAGLAPFRDLTPTSRSRRTRPTTCLGRWWRPLRLRCSPRDRGAHAARIAEILVRNLGLQPYQVFRPKVRSAA